MAVLEAGPEYDDIGTLQLRNRQLEQILSVTSSVRLDQTQAVLLRRLARITCEVLGYYSTAIYLYDDRQEYFVAQGSYALSPYKWNEAERPPVARALAERIMSPTYRLGVQSFYLNEDAELWSERDAEASFRQGATASELSSQAAVSGHELLVIPLVTEWSGLLGFMVPSAPVESTPPTADSVRVLELMASRVASLIQDARLYQNGVSRIMELEEQSSMRRDFVSTVSHELRTPLTAIIGFTETLLEYWSKLPDARRFELLHKSQSAAYRLNRLVQDLLLISRLDAHAITLNPRRVRLTLLVDQAASEVRNKYGGQTVNLNVPVDLYVFADPHRVEQVLVNLLDNGAKYSDEGSPITVDAEERNGMAIIRVQDRGRGIDPSLAHLLFTRFGKIEASIRSGHVGMGLGLFISKQLVESMGGRIWVEASSKDGTVFAFTVPAASPVSGDKEGLALKNPDRESQAFASMESQIQERESHSVPG